MREELSDAIDNYLRFRASQGLAKNTLANEKSTLKLLLAVTGNLWVHRLEGQHVTRFFEEASKTRKASSQAPMYASLTKFFEWARHTKRLPLDVDPMFGRRRPKTIKRERQRVHVSKFPQLLDVAEALSPWHRALTATLLYTLLRGGEVTGLRIRDVDLDAEYLTARITKSGVEDRVPVSAELDIELRRWLTAYTNMVGVLQPHYFLIPARRAVAVFGDTRKIVGATTGLVPEQAVGQVARIVTPILEQVGVNCGEKGEGGHTIRRSGARALFDALSDQHHPRPLRVVKDLLHHSSEATTELYIGVEADRLDRDSVLKGQRMYGGRAKVIPFSRAQ